MLPCELSKNQAAVQSVELGDRFKAGTLLIVKPMVSSFAKCRSNAFQPFRLCLLQVGSCGDSQDSRVAGAETVFHRAQSTDAANLVPARSCVKKTHLVHGAEK